MPDDAPGLYDDRLLEGLRRGAAAVAGHWGLSPHTTVELLAISENATFLARDPERAAPVVLRVHRPGYHERAEIESELAWIEALRRDRVVETPEPLRSRKGGHLAAFEHGEEIRHVAAFAFMSGREPELGAALAPSFEALGGISARLHAHARAWRRPAGFTRKVWDFETTLGARPHWGDWRAARGLTGDGRALLERACAKLRTRLAALGTGPGRFGLIHADLRLANLLVDGERLGVIDFDDCGFGWFAYDFAAAVSFFEHDPVVEELAEAWAAGYQRVAPLAPEDRAALPALVLLRRLLLTAWIASHPETPAAVAAGPAYLHGSLTLAERFLEADSAG